MPYYGDKTEIAQANKVMYPLYEMGEHNNAILATSDELYNMPTEIMTVNHNFLNSISVLDLDGERIQALDENKFYCFIPENLKEKEEKITHEVRSWIYFNQGLGGMKMRYIKEK